MHYIPYSEDYLAHHGILGMKWGVRRWQNKDGSLTDAGRKHYGYDSKTSVVELSSKERRKANRLRRKLDRYSRKDYLSAMHGKKRPNRKNVTDLLEQVENEELDSDDGKKLIKARQKAERALEEYSYNLPEIVTKKHAEEYYKLVDKYEKANQEYLDYSNKLWNSYKSDFMGAKLKDLGLEDTAEGRKLLEAVIDDKDWLAPWPHTRKV